MKSEDLIGKTFSKIWVDTDKEDNAALCFETTDGYTGRWYHSQACCEQVSIESIDGDLSDLVGSPITIMEVTTNSGKSDDPDSSSTWTFYIMGTDKGRVTIRWFGASNGYYSEEVDFEMKKTNEVK